MQALAARSAEVIPQACSNANYSDAGRKRGGRTQRMYEMRYLTQQDMPYFHRLAEAGKAVIIELSDQALIQMDPENFRKLLGDVERKHLDPVLQEQDMALKDWSKKGQQLTQEIMEMEKLLEESVPADTETRNSDGEAAISAEQIQIKKMIEEMIISCMKEINSERNGI